jgi:hypothetical protein
MKEGRGIVVAKVRQRGSYYPRSDVKGSGREVSGMEARGEGEADGRAEWHFERRKGVLRARRRVVSVGQWVYGPDICGTF